MSFYIRKSVKAGPFRFNLSKGGLGVSVGVPGFRVGSGPRGNYIHAGRGGVYYRASLGGGRRRRTPSRSQPATGVPVFAPSDGIVMHDATGASAEELIPTGSGDLVQQLNGAARRHRLGPWLAAALVVTVFLRPPIGLFLLLPGIPAVVWLWLRDRARRSVVAFYDVHDDVERWFAKLVACFEALGACDRVWRVNAAGRIETTYQFKVNSGASKIISRERVAIAFDPPAVLKTNIKVPTAKCGKHSLSFLPDRVLVCSGRTYSDAPYSAVSAAAYAQRFIEDERPPRDALQVDATWQFVNVKGGPDRRFKNNRMLPVMLYGRLEIATADGLFWVFDTSLSDVVEPLAAALLEAPANLAKVHEFGEALALPAGGAAAR